MIIFLIELILLSVVFHIIWNVFKTCTIAHNTSFNHYRFYFHDVIDPPILCGRTRTNAVPPATILCWYTRIFASQARQGGISLRRDVIITLLWSNWFIFLFNFSQTIMHLFGKAIHGFVSVDRKIHTLVWKEFSKATINREHSSQPLTIVTLCK